MRTALLMLSLSVGLVGSAAAEEPSQPAVWVPRNIPEFTYHNTVASETMRRRGPSCNQLHDTAESLLKRLGMRAGDFKVDSRPCHVNTRYRTIDVTFSALVPTDKAGTDAAGPAVQARWQAVSLKGDCAVLAYATKTVLPLFTARNVKAISNDECTKSGIGLQAEVLMAPQ